MLHGDKNMGPITLSWGLLLIMVTAKILDNNREKTAPHAKK